MIAICNRIIFILLFCGFPLVLFSQHGNDAFECTLGTGNVVQNHPDFPEVKQPAYTASVYYSRHFNGYKPWHRHFNYPRMGLNLTGGAIGNRDVLGHFAGLMAQMSFEKSITKRWFYAPNLSLGATWFSKPFNERDNPGNVVIGSAVTFLTSAELITGYTIADNVSLIAKLTLLHASNSHFKLPNVGLNLPVISFGARYAFSNQKTILSDTIRLPEFKKWRFNFRMALGINESGSSTTPVNGPKYPIYLASVTMSKMLTPVNKFSAGVEAWYNKGVYNFIVSQEFYETNRHQKAMAAAIVLGHEFMMGHFGLVTTGGIYFYNPFYSDRQKENEIKGLKSQLKSIIPARLGVHYYLKNTNFRDRKNLFFGLYIKTNFGQADFLESGFGYIF